MLTGDASSLSTTRKHHRIHPIAEFNPNKNDTPKAHTIVNLPTVDDDRASLQRFQQRSNSQTSTSSSSMDARATDVIKRITNPSGPMSNTDEILPQTFFRRMSASFNMNSFVPNTNGTTGSTTISPMSISPSIHDVQSIHTNDENNLHSIVTATTTLHQTQNECEICCSDSQCEHLQLCEHQFCHTCLDIYLKDKIHNGCPALLECPHDGCKQIIHPQDIQRILNDAQLYDRYELFMLRRVLQKLPDTRWCPYPNCHFALLVENTRKASQYDCPVCKRPFCQRCSQIWHPDLSCEAASAQRAALDPTLDMLMKSSSKGGSIRPCPRCKSPIEKLNDGSCNHIRCAICTCEFCWLCMKEVDNLHFITPTGCTFYGKQRWSKGKSILFLVLSWILTPIIAVLAVAIAIPVLLILMPIFITQKFYRHAVELDLHCCRRVFLSMFIFIGAVLLTPLILVLALLIGIPLLIFFIYFYMPQRYISANF